MQFDERVHRYPAGADLHACARDRIEHPRRHNRDDAGLRFDLHEPPGDTLLAAAEANATPVEGMPAIMDHDFLPDMGRMTRRLPSPGRMRSSPGSDGGAAHWAVIASLIETCKLIGVEPQAYLADVISRIVNGHPQSRLDELLPWAYPTTPALKAAA